MPGPRAGRDAGPAAACRVCLDTAPGAALRSLQSLRSVYTRVLGRACPSLRLLYVCQECAHHLRKYEKFRRKSQRASELLERLYANCGEVISTADIESIDRVANDLVSPLSISNLSPIDLTGEAAHEEDLPRIETERNGVWVLIDKVKEEDDDDIHREVLSGPAMDTDSDEEKPLRTIFEDSSVKVRTSNKERRIQEAKRSRHFEHKSVKRKKIRPSSAKDPVRTSETKHRPSARRKYAKKPARSKEQKRKDFGPVTKDTEIRKFAKVVVMSQAEAAEDIRRRVDSSNYTRTTYKCELCFRGFWENSTFRNHMMKHDPENGSFECDFCHFRFVERGKLVSHIRAFHTLKIHCKKCDYVSTSGCLARLHEAWHNGASYTCHLCEEKFRYYTTLRNHIRIKHPMQFACALCGLCFVSQHGVETHVQRSHRCERVKREGEGHFCAECDVTFATQEAWKRHLVVSARHNLKETANGCEICGEVFPTKKEFQVHHRLHYSMNPLKYKLLRRPRGGSGGGGARSRPLSTPESDEKQDGGRKVEAKNLMCEMCGKVCTTITGFRVHLMKHTGEKPYKCTVCNKSFSVKVLMNDHIRTHTKEKPFECTKCSRGFSVQSNLRRHVKLVHSDAQPVSCDLCRKQFKNSLCLKDHVKYVHLKKPYPVRKARYARKVNQKAQRADPLTQSYNLSIERGAELEWRA